MCGRSGGTYLSAGRTQAAAPASPISGPRRAPGSYRDIRQADVLRLRPLPGGLPLTLAVVKELSEAELDALIDEATVDCYNEDEELAGFAVMIEDNLAVPFETMVLGVAVTVEKIDQAGSGIVAICVRGQHRQAIAILDLPLPDPPPQGAEWIAAYRHWAG